MRPILLFTFCISLTSFAYSQSWQELYNEALISYDEGDYEGSITKGKDALQKGESDLERLFTLKLLSTAASESGKYEEGIGFGLQEVHLISTLDIPDSSIYNSLHTLSINLIFIEDYSNACKYLKSCSQAAFNHYGESSYEFNQVLSELGYSYYMVGDLDSAQVHLEMANRYLIKDPEGGIDYLNNLLLIGIIQAEMDREIQAEAEFIKLKGLLELNNLKEELIYAETCENLGEIQYNLQQYEVAEITLQASLSCYTALGYENSEIPDLINSLALVYLKNGQKEKSDSLLRFISSQELTRNVFINQINEANTFYSNGEYAKAIRIVSSIEPELASETYKDLLAEVYLLQVKLNLVEKGDTDIEKINYCLETFLSNESYDRQVETYLIQSRIQVLQFDFSAANISVEKAFSILDTYAVSQEIKYLIIRESLNLDLRQGNPVQADSTFAMISSKGYLEKTYREDLMNDYALLLQIYGYVFESSMMFDQLVEISQYPKQAEYHISLVKSLIKQSIYSEAKFELDKLQKSAMKYGIDDQSEIFAEIYSLNAKVYLNDGDYSNAEIGFRKSINIIDNELIKNNSLKADIYNSAAIFYQTIGNYEQALEYYARAEEFSEAGSSISVDILQNIATLKQIIGDYLESIIILETALEEYEKIYGKEHPAYATSLQNLATAHQKSGNPEKALPYLEQALRIDNLNNLTETVSHTTKRHNLAVLYQELDMLEESEKTFGEVVQMRKEILGENHPDYAFSLYNHAVVLQRLEKDDKAREVFNEAIEKYKVLVKDFFPYLSEKEKNSFYSRISGAFTAWKDFTVEYAKDNPTSAGELFDFQLENKAVLLNSSVDLRSKISNANDDGVIRLFDEWLSLKEQAVKLLALSEADLHRSGESVEGLQKRANDLEKELSLKAKNFNTTISDDKVSWKDVRDNLKEGDAAIEIFRIRKNIKNDSVWYVGLIIKHDTKDYPELEIFENGLEMEEKWFRYYRNSIQFKVTDTVSFAKFWKPLEIRLDGIKSIYVSPDGIFNKVSISSLYDPVSENYVLNKYRVQYLTNIQELIGNNGNETVTTKNVHLYGDPLFSMKGDGTGISGNHIDPLPGTLIEVGSIDNILKENNWQSDVKTGISASERNIKLNELKGVIHIATHGIFLEDREPDMDFYSLENNPLMRSGLLMAGAENSFLGSQIVLNTSVEGEDGILTAYEVMNMDLSSTDLVILSACETGLGEVKNGEGVYGLQRAFAIAGAGSVVISLWRVDDEATKNLMVSFYKYYALGKNKSEALVAAQKEMAAQYSDPYFWGAFILTGI